MTGESTVIMISRN